MFFGLGILGLLWAMVFTNLIGFFINSYYSKELINYSSFQQIKDIVPIFFSAIIAGGLNYSLIYLLNFSDLVLLIIQIPFGIMMYLLFSKLFKVNELKIIKELMNLKRG